MNNVLLKVSDTCKFFFATISHTGLQVLQLDPHLLIVSHRLFAFPPDKKEILSKQILENKKIKKTNRKKSIL